MTKRLLVLLALLLVVGCGPDPEKEAKADAIRTGADLQYLATATAVAIRQEMADVAVKATATAIADKETVRAETQEERIARQESLIKWSTVSLVVFMLALAASLSIASAGGAVAVVRYANLRTRLIWQSEKTRSFPIYIPDKWRLVDFETGERARLDTPNQPHPGKLIGSIQARVTGLLAQAVADVARSTRNAQPADMLPAIGQSVPLLDSSHWLPELREAVQEGKEGGGANASAGGDL